jgi:diacylglycerol kinase (ATP)
MAEALPLLSPLVAPAPVRKPRPLRSLTAPLLLVANANASGLVSRPGIVEAAATLLRSRGAGVQLRLTSSLEEVGELLSESERRVVLLGGDGTLHAAANVPGPKPELALLPAGRANNVARSLGIPTDLAQAARLAVEGGSRPLDGIVAQAAGRRYVAVEGVSVGFHAIARSGYRAANSADVRAAIRTGARAFARFQPIAVGLDVDGDVEVLRTAQLFVVNTPLYGPGLRVAPADPADGLLDLVSIDVAGRPQLAARLAQLRRGTHLGKAGVRHLRARRVRIATGGSSPIVADTTDLGSGTVDLAVVPGAISVVGGRA